MGKQRGHNHFTHHHAIIVSIVGLNREDDAVPSDEVEQADAIDLEEVRRKITEHIGEVFSHDPDRTLRVGELLPASAAETLVRGEQLPR